MDRNTNLFVNIPADGLEAAVITAPDLEIAEYAKNVKRYISAFLTDTPTGTMLFNICYKRSVVESNVFDSMLYNVSSDGTKTVIPECASTKMLSRYRAMIERGIDIVEMAIAETKAHGAQAWISLRMNDHHFPEDPSFNSSFSYDYPEKYGINGSRCYLDYTKREVREYYKAYIREMCGRYDIDGIEFDFLRSCPIMADPDCEIMNGFLHELRNEVNRIAKMREKIIKLGVRIHAEEAQCLDYGIDAAQWIADGSVDVVVPEAFYIPTYFDIPVDKWRESIDERNADGNLYSLLCGTDWGIRCDARPGVGRMMWLTLEQLKGFASAMFTRGADGIYMFNHFITDGNEGAITYYVDENGVMTAKNVLKDKLRAIDSQKDAESGLRVHVKTCRDYHNTVYPIGIAPGTSYKCEINTGNRPQCGTYTVVCGIDGDNDAALAVKVNGNDTVRIGDIQPAQGFEWKVEKANEPVAKHVSEVASHLLRFTADITVSVRDGMNEVEIINNGTVTQYVKWLEIQVNNKNK